MATKDSDFLKQLLVSFQTEAKEHTRAISAGLSELAQPLEPERQAEIIEMVFRQAHSLKGGAWIVNMTEIQAVCHLLESIFAAWKHRKITPTPELLHLLHQAVDDLDQFLVATEAEQRSAAKSRLDVLVRQLEGIAQAGLSSPGPPRTLAAEAPGLPEQAVPPALLSLNKASVEEPALLAETVRVSTAQLDSLLLQGEELIAAKLAAGARVVELGEASALLATWDREWVKVQDTVRTLRAACEAISNGNGQGAMVAQVVRLLTFLEWNRTHFQLLESRVTAAMGAAVRDQRLLNGMVDNLVQDMKQVLMLPFSSLLGFLPRMVRTLAREQGKEVDLVIQGAELEVDRRILQEIKDPLIHLVRNCIHHGIEEPQERVRKKKPPRGTVTIRVTQRDGNKVEILLGDDGAGIDVAQVRAAAVRQDLVAPEAAETLSEQEVAALIFQSGLSTSTRLTDLSGRGLGLSIVQEKVEKLGGIIAVETEPDVGTTFRILLPLTLATFRGILVRVRDRCFVFPTTYVERVAKVRWEEIQTIESRTVMRLNGQLVSLVRLGQALELPVSHEMDERTHPVPVVVVSSAEKQIAFQVDEILSEQEVLIKSLGPQLARVRNIAGATVLGTGQVVPILNVPDLIKAAAKAAASTRTTVAVEHVPARPKSILVVEDSITARVQLKNILALAGYTVETAADGVDAWARLRTQAFDLVVSDVDMPRMDGFTLTAKIRADKKLAELPVVLVTALESRESRERGLEVGADAYMVKGNFDLDNLLAMIERLI